MTFEQICSTFKTRSAQRKTIKKWMKSLRRTGEVVRLRNKTYKYKPVDPRKVSFRSQSTGSAKTSKTLPRRRAWEDEKPTFIVGGLLKSPDGRHYVVPFGKEPRPPVTIESDAKIQIPAEVKNPVVAVRVNWTRSTPERAYGRIETVLGDASDPKIDSPMIIYRHDIPRSFAPEISKAAQEIATVGVSQDSSKREDLRHLLFVTIDGADARDHDDAVAIESAGTVWVAIADVGQYVKPDTLLDREAAHRGNSFYFPDCVIPMLPEELSNDLCSLRPKVDRAVLAARLTIDRKGSLKDVRLCRGLIHSKARLTYEGVDDAFRNPSAEIIQPDILKMLAEMKDQAEQLYRGRMDEGGIDFDLSETRIVLNPSGNVTAMARRERTPSQRIIEELMLLANKAVAKTLSDAGFDAPYRVHAPPEAAKLDELFEIFRAHDFRVALSGETATPQQVDSLIKNIKDDSTRKIFSYLVLRTMSQAFYSTNNIGHYGLGFPFYVHFTSPIRRYADLLIHRQVRELLDRRPPNQDLIFPRSYSSMETICTYISSQERRAQKAEREIRTVKGIRFLKSFIGKHFEGVITGVIQKGFFVELTDHSVEGFVHTRRLPKDYYVFKEQDLSLTGRRHTFRVGDELNVRLESVDLETFRVEFSLQIGKA